MSSSRPSRIFQAITLSGYVQRGMSPGSIKDIRANLCSPIGMVESLIAVLKRGQSVLTLVSVFNTFTRLYEPFTSSTYVSQLAKKWDSLCLRCWSFQRWAISNGLPALLSGTWIGKLGSLRRTNLSSTATDQCDQAIVELSKAV